MERKIELGSGKRTEKSKELAFLLRHDKSYAFDAFGWREVADLVTNHGYTQELLDEIVETDPKGRYEYTGDRLWIRARQGHSVNVDVELEEKVPPEILYHGTATRFIESIRCEGIRKQTRLYVHLSDNYATAVNVGRRHGVPTVIKVDAKRMHENGIRFYLSGNGIWLTDFIDPEYLIF